MQLVDDSSHQQFRAIYRDEFAFVWAVARRLGVPRAALDDAVQDVFLTAFRRIDRLGYQVSPRAWLYAVTRKVASHHRRGAARLARRVAALQAVERAAEVPQERHDAAELLAQLLAPLPRGTREVWEMTEILGMTGPEIAAELELPLNTVYSRLRLARAQLSADTATVSAGVAAAKQREAPPPEAAQRGWAALLPMLRPASFTSVAAAWTGARVAVATTLIAGTVGLTAVTSSRPRAATPAVAVDEPAATPRPRVASPTVTATEPVPAAPARRVTTSASDRLAAEVALLDAARDQLAAQAPGAALALLAEHQRRFPDGALHDARETARVDAYCRLGDAAAAEATARRLLVEHHDSLLARNYEHYVCAP